ncbi:hypothetical protein [Chelativorans sp. AA-79]|uniref:hypothetical protein n=1 Tax=Chelativorans sp. AA-79 TaxID=3028735 RepID=UPI0023F88711|nr:hypothetical protein [Chelativorans sp. AA-79]WEX10310.1 hypothetical protein PVE73_04950 [Chelativorans sp. AA-79]
MAEPIFFSEKLARAIEGKQPGEQLDIIAGMIAEAEAQKAVGYGPPRSDIYAARRKWLAIYDAHLAPVTITSKDKESCVSS